MPDDKKGKLPKPPFRKPRTDEAWGVPPWLNDPTEKAMRQEDEPPPSQVPSLLDWASADRGLNRLDVKATLPEDERPQPRPKPPSEKVPDDGGES